METIVVVLRPKQHGTVSQDFRPRGYDILLMDVNVSNTDKLKIVKQLPRSTILYEQEPADALFQFLYELTGAELGGLKGKRAVFIAPSKQEQAGERDVFVKGTLYCVPVDSRDKLNPSIVDNLPHSPGFYSLDLILESVNTNTLPCTRQTKIMLLRLESWLKEKHNVPGAIDLLFSVCTEDRLKRCITNPAYFSETTSGSGNGSVSTVYSRSLANEALAKMMSIEKCDITIINPLFGSDLNYKTKVDKVTVNKFWGLGRPDYNKVIAPPPEAAAPTQTGTGLGWVEEYPLHKCAYEGDARGIKDLVKKGYTVTKQDKDSWAPIHYAAWFGHLEAISVLLNDGECSPNIANDNGSTPLHLAASKGRVYVIELLLNHPETDSNALDKYNKTPLDLCEGHDLPDWKAAAQLLRSAMSRPAPKIQVCLMDGTFRVLDLVSGANTTVQQLHQQMMRELDMPDSCGHLFTVWICSRNLQLQLKPDHKPIQHLNDWKRKIVGMLTDQDPSREDPQLYWRRDAILSIVEERKVKQSAAVNLLFHEAYHNYIKSFYPCADQDAIILGGVLMQLNQGDYDVRKAKTFFSNESSMRTLVPVAKQRNKNVNWASKIQAQYQHYSQTMANRDRSPQILQQHFLTICWNLTVYGSAFFTGYVQIKTSRSPTTVYIGVNDLGIHIINAHTKSMLQSFSYKDIEWQHKTEQAMLEIRLKGSSKGGMCVLTRQAGLINHLMSKLAQLNTPPTAPNM